MSTNSIQFYTIHAHMLVYRADYRAKNVCGTTQNESFNIIQVTHLDNMVCNNLRILVFKLSPCFNCNMFLYWVILRRLSFNSRRFGTPYRFNLHRPMKMEPIRSSETSAIKTQTPGNYPKRNILQLKD